MANLTKEKLLEDIVHVASETGAKKLSYSLYRICGGKYTPMIFYLYFDNWAQAVRQAGLEPGTEIP